MEFELTYTAAQEEFRAEVRAWLEANVPPELASRPEYEVQSPENYALRRQLGRALGERGWLYPGAPRAYGGGGYDVDSLIVLEEESHRLGLTLPPYYDSGGRLGSVTILTWGSEEQKQALLPPIYRGEVRTWQLLSEPSAGSDLASVQMSARRRGDDYVLNGQKVYVGSDNGAERLWVITVTDPEAPRHENLSWFMVDADSPGITVVPQELLSALGEGEMNLGHKNTIFFDDVVVPAERLVGGENNGWRVAGTHLEFEHGAAGSIRRPPLWERLLEHCRTTVVDGRPMIEDPAVVAALAEIYTRLESLRLLGVRNFWLSSHRMPMTYHGPQASYLRKTTGLWLTRRILELCGPAALTSDPEWGALDGLAEGQQREGIVGIHPGGTTDIQRVIMARGLGVGKGAPGATVSRL
jgi:alkylation response protein AidB-like acyl-CoA dehydrogenase